MDLLKRHEIADKVLAITTDNASNNSTLMEIIQDAIQSLNLGEGIAVIRVPCLAHVIQLSLKQLLGQMKAEPKNDIAQKDWSDHQEQSPRNRPQQAAIIGSLNKVRHPMFLAMSELNMYKVRRLAIFVNASPQRREQFCELQTEVPKLVPIQDIRTRWNSTFLKFRRAKRLRLIFDQYCLKYGQSHLMLDQEEWRQIDCLLWITRPFFKFTTALSKTKDVTLHLVFGIFNMLLDHMEKSIRQLQRKRVPWKKGMLAALYAAKDKLAYYYGKTDDIHGDLLAIGTILAPQHKLQFFKDWAEEDVDWASRYRNSCVRYFEPYSQRYRNSRGKTPDADSEDEGSEINLDMMIQPGASAQLHQQDELTRYLDAGWYRAL